MMLYSCLMTPPFSLAKALALKIFVSIKASEIIGNGHTFPAPQRGRRPSEWSRDMLVRILLKIKLSLHCKEAWFQIARFALRWLENVKKGDRRRNRRKERIYRREGLEGKATHYSRGRCVETGTLQSFILTLILSSAFLRVGYFVSCILRYFCATWQCRDWSYICLTWEWWLLQTHFLKARFSLHPLLDWL